MKYFITGNSSGLGKALSRHYLEIGNQVYGLSRRGCNINNTNLFDCQCDLQNLNTIPRTMDLLCKDIDQLEVVFLNAGILGRIERMMNVSMKEIECIMNINVWSNKIILDWFLQTDIKIDQIILISSGVSTKACQGWASYALSKATLNMLTQLYSHEFNSVHLIALAPGLVNTAMQDQISDSNQVDVTKFPEFQRLKKAKESRLISSSTEIARKLVDILPNLKRFKSGSFVDIRDLSIAQ